MKFVTNIPDDKKLLEEYFLFISKIFSSISFNEWFEKGYWKDIYRTYLFIDDNKIVSSASIYLMDLFINGNIIKAGQISAVATLPEYRGQDLSRKLLNHIFNKYTNEINFYFLYGNDSVLNFYPKFDFKLTDEFIFADNQFHSTGTEPITKLNYKNVEELSLIESKLRKRFPLTKKFGCCDYTEVTLWHILNNHFPDIYYHKEQNILLISKTENKTFNLFEIISERPVNVTEFLKKLNLLNDINKVIYHFPDDINKFKFDEIISQNNALFVKSNDIELSEKFKFPVTGIT